MYGAGTVSAMCIAAVDASAADVDGLLMLVVPLTVSGLPALFRLQLFMCPWILS